MRRNQPSDTYTCPKCKGRYTNRHKVFCPHCGVNMYEYRAEKGETVRRKTTKDGNDKRDRRRASKDQESTGKQSGEGNGISRLKRLSCLVLLLVSFLVGFFGIALALAEESVPLAFVSMALASGIGVAAVLSRQRGTHQSKIDDLEQQLEQQREKLEAWKSARMEQVEEAWFQQQLEGLSKTPIREDAPEVEVEAKFIYPLLSHLGYDPSEMNLRVPVPMQEGSQLTVRQADWVVRTRTDGESLVVVEAKAPRQSVDDAVAKQARSYAFRLEAPVYVTTNGKELHIYHRGVLRDQCVLSCDVGRLRETWDAIEEVLDRSNVMVLKDQLS